MNGRKVVKFYKLDVFKRMNPKLIGGEVRTAWVTEPWVSEAKFFRGIYLVRE